MSDSEKTDSPLNPDNVSRPLKADFEKWAPLLFVWANLRISASLRRHIDPEDLVQEVWWRALRSEQEFESEQHFRRWLFRVATNVTLEAHRQAKRLVAIGDTTSSVFDLQDFPDDATSVSRRVARDEALRSFVAWISTELDPAERLILVHRGLEHLPFTALLTLVGGTEIAVRKRWQRILARVRNRAPKGLDALMA